MADVIRYDLVERVRVCRGVSNETPVVVMMIATKLHFGIERETFSMFFQRLHVVAEFVVRTASLR